MPHIAKIYLLTRNIKAKGLGKYTKGCGFNPTLHTATNLANYRRIVYRYTDSKRYELTDHLGNVRTLVSDVLQSNISTTLPYTFSNIVAHQTAMYNYYAFGSPKPGNAQYYDDPTPTATANGLDLAYRFGFNGQEKDNEIKGTGNSLDFGARIYDSRLGRWLSLDPLQKKYPSQSLYNFCMNSPIKLKDADGRDVDVAIDGNTITFSSNIYITGTGAEEVANDAKTVFAEFSKASLQGLTYYDVKTKTTYNVKVVMSFIPVDQNDPNVARIKSGQAETSGDNLVEITTDKSKLINGTTANAGHSGENYESNVEQQLPPTGRSPSQSVSKTTSGNIAYLNAFLGNKQGGTVIHESLHNMGLGDRYANNVDVTETDANGTRTERTVSSIPHDGFNGDIMAHGLGFSQEHVNNLCRNALLHSSTRGSNFTMGIKVDNASILDKDKVPQKFTIGKNTYEKR